MAKWLIDERPTRGEFVGELRRARVQIESAGTAATSPVAMRLRDIVVDDNRKLFGGVFSGAQVRIDALVVQGNLLDADSTSMYTPFTTRYNDVRNGQRLFADPGLIAYAGRPKHFLDIALLISRDTKNSDDLAALLSANLNSPKVRSALTALAGLAVAAPQVAAIAGGIAAAATLADVAYTLIRSVADKTIGFYRGCRLEYPDQFGLGRNPKQDGQSYHVKGMSFWFDVVRTDGGN